MSPEPEILIEKRSPKDEFIVLACDGVWDVMSNEDIAAFVGNRMTVTNDLKEISNMVVDTCLHKVKSRVCHVFPDIFNDLSLLFRENLVSARVRY